MRDFILQSDGSIGPNGFVLVDSDGNKIEGVLEASITFEPNQPPQLSLTMPIVGANLGVRLINVWHRCIACDELLDHECPPQTLAGP